MPKKISKAKKKNREKFWSENRFLNWKILNYFNKIQNSYFFTYRQNFTQNISMAFIICHFQFDCKSEHKQLKWNKTRGYAKPCYKLLWATMTHNNPQWPKIISLWPIMTQNCVNCFTMTQSKILGLFIFLNFIPNILFLGKCGPEISKCFI